MFQCICFISNCFVCVFQLSSVCLLEERLDWCSSCSAALCPPISESRVFIIYLFHMMCWCVNMCVCVVLCSAYWPLFLLFFYILSPIPYCISRRVVDDTDSASNACKELAIFLTTGIVVSAFGLPIIFARASVVNIKSSCFCHELLKLIAGYESFIKEVNNIYISHFDILNNQKIPLPSVNTERERGR